MSSLSQQQIARFQGFGFVVVRGLLDPEETAALGDEVTAALGDAFEGIGTGTEGGDNRPAWTVERLRLLGVLGAGNPR